MIPKSHRRVLVVGAGGFIGGHLVADLRRKGFAHIRALDRQPLSQWHQVFPDVENLSVDIARLENCHAAVDQIHSVYNLATVTGGVEFLEKHKAECVLSGLINTHLMMASAARNVKRYFFSSSACVYNTDRQAKANAAALREEDAYPAMAEDGHGWEKLYAERMCRHFREEFGLETRIARYHGIYGPHCTFRGGRETAPAAICRKVIDAKLSGRHVIEIWGDGEQTRSFTYIDDCILGTQLIMESDYIDPLNLGSDRSTSINRLVDIVEEIAEIKLRRIYNPDAPQGVRGRNSENTRLGIVLGWIPTFPLELGLERTYRWVYDQMIRQRAIGVRR
jgi:GDP-D-mannose 3',5'-epimerase